jgi:hypothetical protein
MDIELIGQAKQFDEKIDGIKNQFFAALDDFKKYYVYYNKNPEVDEFQNYYMNSKSQLQKLSKDLFLITNNIDKNIEILDNKMSAVSLKLKDEKKLNANLKTMLKNLQNTKEGSTILIDDSKEAYNTQYYHNWEIIIGIFIISIVLRKMFTPSVVPVKR